jgi:hypothetical protein
LVHASKLLAGLLQATMTFPRFSNDGRHASQTCVWRYPR